IPMRPGLEAELRGQPTRLVGPLLADHLGAPPTATGGNRSWVGLPLAEVVSVPRAQPRVHEQFGEHLLYGIGDRARRHDGSYMLRSGRGTGFPTGDTAIAVGQTFVVSSDPAPIRTMVLAAIRPMAVANRHQRTLSGRFIVRVTQGQRRDSVPVSG